jgi:hypothetical protein
LRQTFIEDNHDELKRVLKRFEFVDKGLLDLITYPQHVINHKTGKQYINTPLQIAVTKGSMRTIDLILSMMALVEQNNSVNFKSIFPDLIQYESFQDYLTNLPIQTKQMTYK